MLACGWRCSGAPGRLATMSQLVLNGLPNDLLERLDVHARQLGISVAEAASRILSRSLPPTSDVPLSKPGDSPLIERDGLLLHGGQLAPGAVCPDLTELREERVDELLRRSLEGGV